MGNSAYCFNESNLLLAVPVIVVKLWNYANLLSKSVFGRVESVTDREVEGGVNGGRF